MFVGIIYINNYNLNMSYLENYNFKNTVDTYVIKAFY